MDTGRKISFFYTDYDVHKNRYICNEGQPYTLSPYTLIWDGDYYYVRGYCDEREDMRNFRMDRIDAAPVILQEASVPKPEDYNVADYSREVFRMYDTDERGMIEYDGASRTIVTKLISKFSPVSFSAPVVGAIPCGSPELEEENIQEYVSLPVSLFGQGEYYLLRADGDSMVDAGIDDEDLIVIRKQDSAKVGDIVVALDENQENTLKVYAGQDEISGAAILRYCNQSTYPDKEIRVRHLVVQGVAKHVIKALGPID